MTGWSSPPDTQSPRGDVAVVQFTIVEPDTWSYFVADSEGSEEGTFHAVDALVLFQDGHIMPYAVQDGFLSPLQAEGAEHGRLTRVVSHRKARGIRPNED